MPTADYTLNIRGRLYPLEAGRPKVMGIVNATPDSFFAKSRADVASEDAFRRRVASMVADGADMLDVGGYSSRPGAADVPPEEEARRLERALRLLRREAGDDIPVSVDTFRASIAREAVEAWGADIINDISGGQADEEMFSTVAAIKAPYILMHMRGTPQTMTEFCSYPEGVVAGVLAETAARIGTAALAGIADIIVDPGFGFAKTVEQNYELMAGLETFRVFRRPILVGISRKSMLTKPLGITTDEALNATTALNAYALDRGAAILRVHDVREAREAVRVFSFLKS